MRFLKRKAPSFQKTAVPQQFCQKRLKLSKNSTSFAFLVVALLLLSYGSIFPRKIDHSMQNYTRKLTFFENMSDGPRYGSLCHLGSSGQRRSKIRGPDCKKKVTKIRSEKLITCKDSTFDVDYDFAIKHSLTQWFDQIMGVRS